MHYFGGLGGGKGWLKFSFVVEPAVFRQILEEVKPILIVTNTRVPIAYKSTPVVEFLAAYSTYVDAMLKSPAAAREAADEIYVGFAVTLKSFSSARCPDPRFKLMTSDEPVVNASPQMLYFDDRRGQLCTNVFSELYFGVELSYPRVISLDRDKHRRLYDTSQFATCDMFHDLKSRLQKETRLCKIRSPIREHRTTIRISDQMRSRMTEHPGLKRARLKIV